MKFKTKDIAITALFVAIVAVMTLTPLGLIPLPIVSINIVLIPIIICAQTTNLKTAVLVSTAFGIFSLINSYIKPTTILAFALQNPLVSIFPRIFIGVTTFFTFKGLKWFFSKKTLKHKSDSNIEYDEISVKKFRKDTYFASLISAIVGVVTNTLGFFAMLLLSYGGTELSSGGVVGLPFLAGILTANFIPEVIAGALICPLVVIPLEKALKR